MPADIAIGEDVEDMGARILGTAPPENGSRFIVMEFAPGIVSEMHRTETIDYIVMLSGEIDMDMDEGSVKLSAGDIMVQRGTNHAWVNRSTAPARLAIVLMDAKPLGIGHPRAARPAGALVLFIGARPGAKSVFSDPPVRDQPALLRAQNASIPRGSNPGPSTSPWTAASSSSDDVQLRFGEHVGLSLALKHVFGGWRWSPDIRR